MLILFSFEAPMQTIVVHFIHFTSKTSVWYKKAAKITDSKRLVGTLVIIYLSGVTRGCDLTAL